MCVRKSGWRECKCVCVSGWRVLACESANCANCKSEHINNHMEIRLLVDSLIHILFRKFLIPNIT